MALTRFRLVICLCIVVLGAATGYGQMLPLFDDFSDGSATDGDPISWGVNTSFGSGTIDVVDNDLVITPTGRFIVVGPNLPALTDASMQLQFRMLQPSLTDRLFFEFIARGDESTGDAYFAGMAESGSVYIRDPDDGSWLTSASTNLRPLEEDVAMQFDVFDSTLSLWAWRPGEPMPSEPLLSAVDQSLSVGVFGFYFGSINQDSSPRSAAVRYMRMAATQSTLAGDFNFNGTVEQADLDLVLLHWGEELLNPFAAGWINDLPNGAVDQEELDAVLLNWGTTANTFGAVAAIPEPSTTAINVLALVCLIACRRIRRV